MADRHDHDLVILMSEHDEPTHVVCDDCGQLWPLGEPTRQIGTTVAWGLLLERWVHD